MTEIFTNNIQIEDATGSVVGRRFEDSSFIGTPNGGPEEKPKDYFDTPITIKPGQVHEINSEAVLII